jgi:hypothetical protein
MRRGRVMRRAKKDISEIAARSVMTQDEIDREHLKIALGLQRMKKEHEIRNVFVDHDVVRIESHLQPGITRSITWEQARRKVKDFELAEKLKAAARAQKHKWVDPPPQELS